MDKIIFISSLIGTLGLGAMLAAPALFRFVKARVLLPAVAKPEPQTFERFEEPQISARTEPNPAPSLLSGSDQHPPKAVVEYLTALRAACPGASSDGLYSMAMAGCSLYEAIKTENIRLLKLSQEEAK